MPQTHPPKRLGAGKITAIVLGSLAALLLLLGIIGAIVGDTDTTADKPAETAPPTTPAATTAPAPTTATPTTPAATTPPPTTAEPTPPATTTAPPAGPPAEPDAATRQAYLDALNKIDPRIIKPGKEDQAVSRGRNQCASIQTTDDEHKLSELALDRFTVTSRLPDIATPETGRRINDAVHTHLCPGS